MSKFSCTGVQDNNQTNQLEDAKKGGGDTLKPQTFGHLKSSFYTVKNGVLQYTFGGVLQDTIMPVGVA